MALIALIGVFVSLYLTLYKLGYVGTLACGTGSCEKVQLSKWGDFLGQPVAAWGVGYYLLVFAVGRWCLGSAAMTVVLFGLAVWDSRVERRL